MTYLWIAKEVRPLYLHEPWQDDPYDAVVSFSFFFIPILAGLCFIRAALCRRASALPLRRVHELLIACRLMLAVGLATLASQWVSLALGANRKAWNLTTLEVVIVLAFLSVTMSLAQAQVVSALRRTPAAQVGPDWWSDAAGLVDLYWKQGLPFGRLGQRAIRGLVESAANLTRAWPIAVAAVISLAFGGLLATSQGIGEDGFAPPVFLLYLSVAGASMFAFLLVAGAHLRLSGARPPMTGRSRRLADAAAAGAAAYTASLAMRSTLAPVTRLVPAHGAYHVLIGMGLIAFCVATTVFMVESALAVHSTKA